MGWNSGNSLKSLLQHFAYQLESGEPRGQISLSKEALAVLMLKEKSAAKELRERINTS